MEDSSELQNLTLTPSETVISFPPHRRRPLRSRTYSALIGILSHCHPNSPKVQIQDGDGGDIRLGPVSEENGSLTPVEVHSKALLVSLPDSKQLEDTLVKETSIGLDKENNGGFDGNQATTPTLDPINSVADGGPEVALKNSISSVDFLVLENQAGDCATQVAKEQDNAKTVDLGTLEDLVVDNDFSIADYSEILDSCFDMDMVTGPSKKVNDSKENATVFEENVLKEAEGKLQLKEMELEKLIYSDNVGEETEEGEISGEADASIDALYEDAASLGERSTEMMHGIEDCSNKEGFMCNVEDRGCRQNKMSDPSLINKVNSDCNSMKVDSRTTDGESRNFHSLPVFHASHMGTKRSNPIASCSEKQAPSDRNLQVNAAENQMDATYAKDDGDAGSKKRKRGARSKKKRAKKRDEKCNFSRDKVPLTKSKPCTHFARNSCMKGDACPYDHQLSKYPCQKFSADGFCRRGSDCLFSHEILSTTPTASKPKSTSAQHTMSAKGGSSSKVSKPDINFSSPLNNSNSSKHADNHGKNTELLAARTVPRTAGQAPKGISCLPKVNAGCKTTLTAGKSNEMPSKIVAPRKPCGINFLSFGRPTPDDSITTMLSKLLSNSNEEARQSVKGSTALPSKLEEATRVPLLSFRRPSDQSTGGLSPDSSNSFKTPFLSKTPGSLKKAVQTTLAFAANFEHSIKVGSSYLQSRS